MRQLYGDPWGAGVDAFAKVTSALTHLAEAPARRKLLEEETLDRKARRELAQEEMEVKRKARQDNEQAGLLAEAVVRDEAARKQQEYKQFETDLGGAITATMQGTPVHTLPENQQAALFRGYKESEIGSTNIEDLDKVKSSLMTLDNFWKQNAGKIQQGGRLPMDALPPEVKESVNVLYGGPANKGQSAFGEVGGANGVKKEIAEVIFDPKDQTAVFQIKTTAPVAEGQVFDHIQPDGRTNIYMAPSNSNPEGLVAGGQGTIDLSKQKVVGHANGSISTVYSGSFTQDGKEILLPLSGYADGKTRTMDEAIREFNDPKSPNYQKHLGMFESREAADRYAQSLSNDPMWDADKKKYSVPEGQKERSYIAPMTADRGMNPDAPVLKIPVPLLMKQAEGQAHIVDNLLELRAHYARTNPQKFYEMERGKQERAAENKAVSSAMESVDPKASVGEQRRQFITAFTKANPNASIKETTDLAKTIIEERKKSYLSRQRQEGSQNIFEESNDGGETWTKVSSGPKWKGGGGSGEGGGKEKKITNAEVNSGRKSIERRIAGILNIKGKADFKLPTDEVVTTAISDAEADIRDGVPESEVWAKIEQTIRKHAVDKEVKKRQKVLDDSTWFGKAKQVDRDEVEAEIFNKPKGKTLTDPEAKPAESKGSPDVPPLSAFKDVPAGKAKKFPNGQVWTVKDGKPERVR